MCLPRRSLPFSRLRRETLLFYISSCVCVEPRLISLRPFLSLELYTSGEALLLLLCILEWRKGKTATVYSVAQHHAPTQMSSLFRLALNIFGSQLGVFFRRSLYNLFVFFFSLIPDGSLSQAVTPKSHTLSLCFHRLVNFTRRLFFGKVTVSNLSRLTEFFKIRIEINTQLALMNAVAISGVYIGTNFSLWVHR